MSKKDKAEILKTTMLGNRKWLVLMEVPHTNGTWHSLGISRYHIMIFEYKTDGRHEKGQGSSDSLLEAYIVFDKLKKKHGRHS